MRAKGMRYPIADGDKRPVTAPAVEEVDANWKRVLRSVTKPDGEDWVILRDGKPVAVMIDWASYQYMSKL